MLLSLSGAPRSLDSGRLSPLAFSSFPAIFQRKACPNPRCHWMRRPFWLLSLGMEDDRLCGCGGLVSSRMGSEKPGANASTGSAFAGDTRLPLNGGCPGIVCGGQGPPAGSESAAVRFLQRRFLSVSSGAFAGGRGDAHFFEHHTYAPLGV